MTNQLSLFLAIEFCRNLFNIKLKSSTRCAKDLLINDTKYMREGENRRDPCPSKKNKEGSIDTLILQYKE